MPIFSRRRLKSMLLDASAYMDEVKVCDLASRLEDKSTKAALAAEAELAILWAAGRVAHLEVEPHPGGSSRRPDAYSRNLFPSGRAYIEVRALSDDSFSGREAMERTANIICAMADRVRKKAGSHLYFEFDQHSYWEKSKFRRVRCVDPDFKLSGEMEGALTAWLRTGGPPSPAGFAYSEGKTKVLIQWRDAVHSEGRTFCRMPSVAYDLEDNPIYKALKKKSRQIKNDENDAIGCVFLFDAGCNILRNLTSHSLQEIDGATIIQHTMRKHSIDVVCVFSSDRPNIHNFMSLDRNKIRWKVSCFDKRQGLDKDEYAGIEKLATQLPAPRYEGYQARSLHRQEAFDPQARGQYIGCSVTTRNGGPMTIKISSRLLQEYLAGRIDRDSFKRWTFPTTANLFELELSRGHVIKSVGLESGGLDEDDDKIVFELNADWSALSLKSEGDG